MIILYHEHIFMLIRYIMITLGASIFCISQCHEDGNKKKSYVTIFTIIFCFSSFSTTCVTSLPFLGPCHNIWVLSHKNQMWMTRPRGYKTWLQSQTQSKAQWLAACGHMSTSSQSLCFILSLRMNSSFTTSRPGNATITDHSTQRILRRGIITHRLSEVKQNNSWLMVGPAKKKHLAPTLGRRF